MRTDQQLIVTQDVLWFDQFALNLGEAFLNLFHQWRRARDSELVYVLLFVVYEEKLPVIRIDVMAVFEPCHDDHLDVIVPVQDDALHEFLDFSPVLFRLYKLGEVLF